MERAILDDREEAMSRRFSRGRLSGVVGCGLLGVLLEDRGALTRIHPVGHKRCSFTLSVSEPRDIVDAPRHVDFIASAQLKKKPAPTAYDVEEDLPLVLREPRLDIPEKGLWQADRVQRPTTCLAEQDDSYRAPRAQLLRITAQPPPV